MSNIDAFLRVIREGESSQDDGAYRTVVGGGKFDSFDDHPRELVHIKSLGVNSTAAGAYQFLSSTWGDVCKANPSITDFSPRNQDLGAVWLIKRRRAYADVIDGRFELAVQKCAKEWASLPGSPYGQPTMTMEKARRVYEQYGGQYEQSEAVDFPPIVDLSVPANPADIQAKIKESPVDPISALAVKSIIGMAADAIPGLIRMFGNKDNPVVERNAKAAQVILDTAKEVTGAINAQDTADKIQNDPEAAAKVRQAIMDNWFRINAEAEKSVAAAREFAGSYRAEKTVRDGLTFIELLSLIFVTLSAVGGGYVLVADFPAELKGGVITLMLIGGWTGVKEFWLGSSRDSQRKTEMLTKQ